MNSSAAKRSSKRIRADREICDCRISRRIRNVRLLIISWRVRPADKIVEKHSRAPSVVSAEQFFKHGIALRLLRLCRLTGAADHADIAGVWFRRDAGNGHRLKFFASFSSSD